MKGFELIGDLCLSLSKIVTEARAVAEDPTIDGFGHVRATLPTMLPVSRRLVSLPSLTSA